MRLQSCFHVLFTQNSGAYIFRPNLSTPFPIADASVSLVSGGPVVQEIRQQFGTWASQTIRLWAGSPEVEIEWTVGPIDISDGLGKEVISKISMGSISTTDAATTWNSNATWATGVCLQFNPSPPP